VSHDPSRGLMPEPSELPPRPLPRRHLTERALAWLRWFGAGRLVAAAVSIAIVVVGGVWLLRAPAPPTEASLPLASGAPPTSTTSISPPLPVTVGTTMTSPASDIVVIHVAGAVLAPGIYELVAPARVADAVAAAGGAAAVGDLDGVNLAAMLADGQRVYVPAVGEVDPAAVASGGDPASPASAGSSLPPGPLDLNAATSAQLELLPGVGPATATAIVDDRERNGPFASIDDLDRVPGIGAAKLEALRPLVTV
jgi:competence protein ComEA